MFNKLLAIVTFLACVATVMGFLGHHGWVFDQVSHFRVQYFFVLAVCALMFQLGRKFWLAILAGAFAVVNFYQFEPYREYQVHASVVRSPWSSELI